jgi:hypothetical protein
MKTILALLALLCAPTVLAQGVYWPPGQSLRIPPASSVYGAGFSAAGCVPTGTYVTATGSNLTSQLTVTRATAQTVQTASGVLTTCSANQLAVSDTPGAEIWKASTNLATTDDLSAGPWTTNTLTVTAGSATARTGAAIGATLTRTGTAAEGSRLEFPFAGTNAVYTASIDLKAGTTSTANLAFWGTNTYAWTAVVLAGPGKTTSSGAAGTYAAVNELSAADWTTIGWTSTIIGGSNAVRIHPETAAAGTNGLTIVAALPQIEASSFATPYISSAAGNTVRNGTTASEPIPSAHVTNRWCVGVTATPGGGRLWNAQANNGVLATGNATTNAFRLFGPSTDKIHFGVYDATGAERYIEVSTGLGATSGTHRFVGVNTVGVLALYMDGVSIGSPAGAGSGLQTATTSPMLVGALTAATPFNGTISNLKININPASWRDCQ